MSGTAKLNNAIRVVTGLIGLALFGYFVLFFAREATKMSGMHRSGGLWSDMRVADSVVVFARVDPSDFLGTPLPQTDDTVTAVNDTAVTNALWNHYFDSLRTPGEQIRISFRHAGDTLTSTALTRTPPASVFTLLTVLQVLRFLIGGLSIGVGLWAFFARPDSAGVRALALFSFTMGAFMITGVQALSGRYAAFDIPYLQQANRALTFLFSFFGAFWLNLQMLFPRPRKFMVRHPVWAYLLCYGLPLLFWAIGGVSRLFSQPLNLGFFILGTGLAQLIVGMVLIGLRYRREQNRLERRQLRLVAMGSGGSLIVLVLIILIASLLRDMFFSNAILALVVLNAAFAILLLSPLSFAYAFGRYRLLEVEGKLRRGTRYVMTIVGLVGIVAAIAYLAGPSLQRTVQAGNTLGFVVLLIIAASLVPAGRIVLKQLERWFYPERLRLRSMIHDFLQHAATIPDKDTFWSELQVKLRDGLRVERVHPVVLIAGNGHYTSTVVGATPFTTRSEFVERLTRERRPVLVDEVVASSRINLTDEEALWLETHRVGLVLPLVSHSNLIGFLGLGQKTEKEDYAAEELRILNSLSSQIALASENIRLIEENVVKRQLEEQLQMARRIQQGFLPQEIPPVKGLEIAAGSRFCLDVAGDYYDVIPLENGQTVLAVGDVSGKGAGAALLMANLQASLRTAVGMGNPLDNVVERVNDLIFRNTPVEQYITFFVGVYDPEESTFTYVNAGHNPPMLVHENGETRLLSTGGLILGFLPAMDYEQEIVKLRSGDLIIMYTDGVSEAMNAAEEEFTEDRICESVCARKDHPLTQALSALEREVIEFHGSDCFEDDFTILLVRVV